MVKPLALDFRHGYGLKNQRQLAWVAVRVGSANIHAIYQERVMGSQTEMEQFFQRAKFTGLFAESFAIIPLAEYNLAFFNV